MGCRQCLFLYLSLQSASLSGSPLFPSSGTSLFQPVNTFAAFFHLMGTFYCRIIVFIFTDLTVQCCGSCTSCFLNNKSFFCFHRFPFAKLQAGFLLSRTLSFICLINLCLLGMLLCFLFLSCFLIRKLFGFFLLFLMTEIDSIRIHLVQFLHIFVIFHRSTSLFISKFQTLFLLWFLTSTILLTPAVSSVF